MSSNFFSTRRLWLTLLCCMFLSASSFATAAKPFPLKDNDRILLIGATHIEQAQYHGYIESVLTIMHPKKHLVFRNLGWAGDNVFGEARAMFGKNEDGFAHLLTHVKIVKPTVIFVQYGTNEAQKGEAGLAAFLKQYNHLLDQLAKETKRIVLLSPIAHEAAASPLPKEAVKQANLQLKLYSVAIKQIAKRRELFFIDMFNMRDQFALHLQEGITTSKGSNITSNGVLLNTRGHQKIATYLSHLFGSTVGVFRANNTDLQKEEMGLKTYNQLRKAILKRNALFFNRSRPQNEVYLRGFRKREQGNNAKEIFQLDALIEKMDLEITAMKKKLK